jgi:hypothetical protein
VVGAGLRGHTAFEPRQDAGAVGFVSLGRLVQPGDQLVVVHVLMPHRVLPPVSPPRASAACIRSGGLCGPSRPLQLGHALRRLALNRTDGNTEGERGVLLRQVERVPQHHTGPLAERQPAQGLLDVDHAGHVRVLGLLLALRPEQGDPPPLTHRAADPGAGQIGDDPTGVGRGMVGGAHPVPAVPEREQRVGREIVGGVRLTRQQVGEPGQFGVVALEEGVELHGGGVVDDCAHGGPLLAAVCVCHVDDTCLFGDDPDEIRKRSSDQLADLVQTFEQSDRSTTDWQADLDSVTRGKPETGSTREQSSQHPRTDH